MTKNISVIAERAWVAPYTKNVAQSATSVANKSKQGNGEPPPNIAEIHAPTHFNAIIAGSLRPECDAHARRRCTSDASNLHLPPHRLQRTWPESSRNYSLLRHTYRAGLSTPATKNIIDYHLVVGVVCRRRQRLAPMTKRSSLQHAAYS
ncbi:hypothetical protein EVAR_3743_1 [Eumeta japonica]|uniref:Uncharacterized protein n=1 Tax=Eumeta variegata TaxID=151549 RepID=A0A4C1SRH8_EUMVA|nr:hypothetical protein EVAR_3743_1 [Eumeta japonica]